jgi:hypothetical protein
MVRRALCALLLSSLAFGCSDLSEFRAVGGEHVYRGTVIGTQEDDCEPGLPCSFIRRGFPPGTTLEMTFDPDAPDGRAGTLTTVGEHCTTAEPDCPCTRAPALDGAVMLTTPPLVHDQLSLYDFPGGGRMRNYVFAVEAASGPLANRDPMAFVSLIRGGRIEVRIVAGSGQGDCDPRDCDAYTNNECDFYGVFHLEREAVATP